MTITSLPDANTQRDQLLYHLNTEYRKPFTGWDFQHMKGRMEDCIEMPWSYENTVRSLLPKATGLLDMGTGGGEFLESLAPLPDDTCATEENPPNCMLARRRLNPLGVTVTAITDLDLRLPLDNARFDLIINRHQFYTAAEVHRLLKQNGLFVTQQVGEQDKIELSQLLDVNASHNENEWNLQRAVGELESVGFTILEQHEEYLETRFYDIGAVVYYVKAIPWSVKDFSVENYENQLLQLHQQIQENGYLSLRSHRFFIKAQKQ